MRATYDIPPVRPIPTVPPLDMEAVADHSYLTGETERLDTLDQTVHMIRVAGVRLTAIANSADGLVEWATLRSPVKLHNAVNELMSALTKTGDMMLKCLDGMQKTVAFMDSARNLVPDGERDARLENTLADVRRLESGLQLQFAALLEYFTMLEALRDWTEK